MTAWVCVRMMFTAHRSDRMILRTFGYTCRHIKSMLELWHTSHDSCAHLQLRSLVSLLFGHLVWAGWTTPGVGSVHFGWWICMNMSQKRKPSKTHEKIGPIHNKNKLSLWQYVPDFEGAMCPTHQLSMLQKQAFSHLRSRLPLPLSSHEPLKHQSMCWTNLQLWLVHIQL